MRFSTLHFLSNLQTSHLLTCHLIAIETLSPVVSNLQLSCVFMGGLCGFGTYFSCCADLRKQTIDCGWVRQSGSRVGTVLSLDVLTLELEMPVWVATVACSPTLKPRAFHLSPLWSPKLSHLGSHKITTGVIGLPFTFNLDVCVTCSVGHCRKLK